MKRVIAVMCCALVARTVSAQDAVGGFAYDQTTESPLAALTPFDSLSPTTGQDRVYRLSQSPLKGTDGPGYRDTVPEVAAEYATQPQPRGPVAASPLLRRYHEMPGSPVPRIPDSKSECVAVTAQTTVGGAAMGFLFGALASSLGVALTGGTDFSSRRWTIITVSTGAAAGFLYGAQRRECRGFLPPVSPRPARMAHHPQLSVPFTRSYQYP